MTWYDDKLNILLNPPEDPAERGFLVLSGGTYPCAGCHTLEDLSWVGVTGPNLNDIGDRAANRIPGLTAEEYLSQSIYESNAFLVPGFGPLMPDFQFEDPDAPNFMSLEDHEAIVAYLCRETASGDPACSLENLQEIIADYE
jgi:hypothetical protein